MPSDIMQASAETTVYIANGIVSTGQGVFFVSDYAVEMPSTNNQPSFYRYNEVIKPLKELVRMTKKISKFTVRVEDEILKKFCYVAEYNARSANKEVEFLMKRHIVKFEKAYGKITFD